MVFVSKVNKPLGIDTTLKVSVDTLVPIPYRYRDIFGIGKYLKCGNQLFCVLFLIERDEQPVVAVGKRSYTFSSCHFLLGEEKVFSWNYGQTEMSIPVQLSPD